MSTTLRHNRPLLFFGVMSIVVHTGLFADFLAHRSALIDTAGKSRQLTMHLRLQTATAPSAQRAARDDRAPVNTAPQRTRHAAEHSSPQVPAVKKEAAEVAPAQTPDSEHPAAAPRASTPSQEENYRQTVSRDLHNWLVQAIAAHFTYPAIARRHHWQGEVRIALRIEADGRVSHVDLVNSSGHAVLDQAALNSLANIARVPHATAWLRGRYFDMVIPIEYRLLDS